MAYSALPAKAAGDTITVTNWDNIRDNFAAGVPDVFTTKGDLAAATAADTATRFGVGNDDDTLVADSGAATGLAWQIQPAVRVYNSGNIDPATGSWVALTFDSERYDTDACHSTASNTSRLTCPANGDGLYHIGGNVELDTSGGAGQADIGLRIYLNGATVIAQVLQYLNASSVDLSLQVHCDYALAATDYVELQVYTSANVDVLAMGNYSPEFWAHWFRRA